MDKVTGGSHVWLPRPLKPQWASEPGGAGQDSEPCAEETPVRRDNSMTALVRRGIEGMRCLCCGKGSEENTCAAQA